MNAVGDFIFSFWFTEAETRNVNAHVEENFELIEYADRDVRNPAHRLHPGSLNRVTREVMFPEPRQVVAIKCLMVTIGNPLHFAIRFIVTVVKSSLVAMVAIFSLDLQKLCEAIIEILEVPYFMVGIELAAILGFIFDSLKGRARIKVLERLLNWDLPFGTEGSIYMARCCQPWVENIDNTGGRYTITRTLPPSGCPACCCLPLLPCCAG